MQPANDRLRERAQLEQNLDVSSPLNNLSPKLLEEMKGKSIFFIVENSIIYEVKIMREGNKLRHQLRQVSENEAQKLVQEKIKTYNSLLPVVSAGIGGSLNIAGAAFVAFVPASGFGKIVEAAGKVWPNTVDNYIQRGDQAKVTWIDGNKEIENRIIEEQRAQIQSSQQQVQQAIDRESNMFDRKAELARTILSQAS